MFIKRLLEILNQVIRIFNADRHSNEMIANSHLRATLWPHFIENRVQRVTLTFEDLQGALP